LDDKEGLLIDNMMLLTDKGSLLTEKKEFFDFTLPSSRHTLQTPYTSAFKAREGE
jgi:hypothetical protein